MKAIVYQPLRTPGGYYIYDRSVNTIFSVSADEYQEFKRLQDDADAERSP